MKVRDYKAERSVVKLLIVLLAASLSETAACLLLTFPDQVFLARAAPDENLSHFFWLYRGWNAFADVNLEQLICSSRMSIEAGSQVEIIVTNPFTSVEMTSMVEDWFTVAWRCVRELCSVCYLLSMTATAAGTAPHLFPLGRLSSNNHGLLGAWGVKCLALPFMCRERRTTSSSFR